MTQIRQLSGLGIGHAERPKITASLQPRRISPDQYFGLNAMVTILLVMVRIQIQVQIIETLRHWALVFGLQGEINPIPSDFEEAPGWWIHERNTDKSRKSRSLYFSLKSGILGYSS